MRTKIAATWIVAHEIGQPHPDPRRRGRLRGQPHRARRQGLRRPRRQDHRRQGQAGGAGLHRHPRAFRPSRLAPADQRHRASHVLRPALPRDLRAQGGQGRQGRSALPQARRCGLRRRLRAQRRLHGGGAAAQRRHHLRRVRQPVERAGRAAGGGDAAWRPGLPRSRLRLRPLGRRRRGAPEARAQRRARAARASRPPEPGSRRTTAPPVAACAASWCRARWRPRAWRCWS